MDERYRWNILVLAYISMLAFTFVLQCIPPVLSLIIQDLNISHAQAGLLTSLFALPGIFLSIPGGILFDLYGTRKIVAFCFIMMIIGTLTVIFGETFFVISLGRIVSGTGASILSIGLPQFLVQWFNGKEIGMAMGIFNTALPMGTIISFTTLGWLGENLGWQVSVSISGIVTVIALIVFLIFYKPAPSIKDKSVSEKGIGLGNFKKAGISIWLVGIAWMWFNASTISFTTFGPDFFITDKGLSIGLAGFLTSFIVWGSFIFSPVVGYLIDKIGFKETLIAIGGFALAVLMFFIPYATSLLIFLMAMVAVAAALVPAPVFSLPSDIMKPQNLGFGFGVISTCLSIGMVLGPYFVGLIRDWTGSYNMSFAVIAGFALCVTITMLILRSPALSKR
ncbi:MAG: MFS transporter [Pseudomonadota bacterium]